MLHRRWYGVAIAALLGIGCNCRGSLRHTTSALVADPTSYDFGKTGVSVAACAAPSATTTFTLTNQGAVLVDVTGVTVTNDARKAFTATLTPGGLAPGNTMKLTVGYAPPSPCPSVSTPCDSATITVASDSGNVDVTVTGTGIDLCSGITCNPTGTGVVAACGGLCCAGQCKYPSGNACQDPAQCLTTGTCDGQGHCQGACSGNGVATDGGTLPACCTTPPGATCLTSNTLQTIQGPGTCGTGTGANCVDVGNGYTCCYEGGTITKTCSCGCAQQPDGTDGCNLTWLPVTGAPVGEYSSVWASSSGDVWVSLIGGTSSMVNPQSVYRQSGGTWQKMGSIANAENPACSGSGCGAILTGDNNGNIYAAADCKDSSCSSGGVWHYSASAGSGTDEWFSPTTLNGCGASNPNVPLTGVVAAGGTAYAINNEPCGPEIVKEGSSAWSVAAAASLLCQAPGAFWGSSGTDFWVSWGCGGTAGSGGLWHWDGSSSQLGSPAYPYPSGEYSAAIFGASSSDVWAVGTHRWHYDGSTWSQDPSTPPGTDSAVWGNGTDYFAGGSYPNIYHYTAATGWQLECVSDNGTGALNDPSVTAIWGDAQGNYYATAIWSAGGKVGSGLMKRK